MKNRINKIVLLLAIFGMVVLNLNIVGRVSAASGGGSGGTANSKVSGCKEGNVGSTTLCKDGTGGGAWRIFKTASKVWSAVQLYNVGRSYGPQYCLKKDQQKNNSNCNTVGYLSKGGYKFDLAKSNKCSASKYTYYLAYSIEGWHGRNYKGDSQKAKKNVFTFWGPLGWGVKMSGKYKVHLNEKNQHSKDEVVAGLNKGTNMNGWKVSEGTAKYFCKKDNTSKCKDYTSGALPTGLGYVCVEDPEPDPEEYSITVYAIDMNGVDLNNEKPVATAKGIENSKVTATAPARTGYSFVYFSTNDDPENFNIVPNDSTKSKYASGNKYIVKNIKEDIVVYAVYTPADSFEGRTTVTGDTDLDTDWTASDEYDVSYIDCSPIEGEGCKIRFNHYLRRTLGDKQTEYVVTRTSNLTDESSTRRIPEGELKRGTFGEAGEKLMYDSGELMMYPGMIVCESIAFKNTSTVTELNASAELCVKAVGEAQPPDPPDQNEPEDPDTPSGDASFLNIKVMNEDVDKFRKFQRTVYAKPGDVLTYRSTYNPILQYTYYLVPESLAIDCTGWGNVGPYTNEAGSKLGAFYNASYSGCGSSTMQTWNNAFSVQFARNESWSSASLVPGKYPENPKAGDSTKQTTTNKYNESVGGVLASDVGKTIDERVITNLNTDTRTTMKQVRFACDIVIDEGGGEDDYIEVEQPILDEEGNPVLDDNGNPITEIVYEPAESSEVEYSEMCDNVSDSIATVDATSMDNVATAKVPYNFDTDVVVDTPNDTPIFAGEEKRIDFTLTIKPRENPVTMDEGDKDYATKIDSAKYKIIVYRGEYKPGGDWASDDLCARYGLPNNEVNCGYSAESNSSFTSVNQFEDTKKKLNRTFYAQDLAAGSQICVAAAFYPANSGSPINMDRKGSDTWRVSDSTCYRIAKRPSIQVWGGDIFTKGSVVTSTGVKNYLAGRDTYSVGKKNSVNYVFGSWGELGVLASGEVKEFASGASTGYEPAPISANGVLVPRPFATQIATLGKNTDLEHLGGRIESTSQTSICNRSLLTFANSPCYSTVGQLGNTIGAEKSVRDKDSIIGRLAGKKEVNVGADVTIQNGMNNYTYSGNSNLTVNGGSVTQGVYLVQSDATVKIAGNITYGGSYTTLTKTDPEAGMIAVPKVVIYGKNIVIDCQNVTRLDAVLIAEEEVKTCDSDDINAAKNSTQLVLNGAVVAGWLTPNRTYGAATGANSIVPAEIIRFDPTLYLWGGGDDDEDEEDSVDIGNFEVTYLQEISSRK